MRLVASRASVVPKRIASLSLVLVFILAAGCEEDNGGTKLPPRNEDSVTISQGIWGDVWFWEGDFMPLNPSGTVSPVSREVVVFELTDYSGTIRSERGGGFYEDILTAEVGRATSRTDGFFQLELPPGEYSVFVVEGSLFYATTGDGAGNISSVTVKANAVTDARIDITYMSTS